uniref:Methyltransferase domain-containing protein n=1 Tax=Amphora coffeiformis TaxID=265554 RepID=A0A7S3LDU8_9STRA|mmetsp:Transcript_11899/g.22760  ORF Transcript_11899/g.22760 Transcript_11899/m.22760 type:complete len:237 (-) Transcript_11899:218-928(-)
MRLPTTLFWTRSPHLLASSSLHHRRIFHTSSPLQMWDERYSEEGFAFGTTPNVFLEQTLPTLTDFPKNAKCLLLAEGEGRNAVHMARLGYDVTGVDSSAVGLKKAQELAASHQVTITTEVVDLADYDYGTATWDCIVGIFCHVPPPIRARMLEAIPGALTPGGYAVFECYTPQQLEFKTGGPPAAAPMYSAELFQEAFGDGKLEIIRNEELNRQVVEGKYHNGQAAVVQFIGRKQK